MASSNPRVIGKKITSVAVNQPGAQAPVEAAPAILSEPTIDDVPLLERPEVLSGQTYKIKPASHAVYVTINDILLNAGTPDEAWSPVEMFVNTKDSAAYTWLTLATRMASAIMRRGGDIRFLIEEWEAVHDPNGGYFSGPKYQYVKSIPQHIAYILRDHMMDLKARNKVLKERLHPVPAPEGVNAEVVPLQDYVRDQTAATSDKRGAWCKDCEEYSIFNMEGCTKCIKCGAGNCS